MIKIPPKELAIDISKRSTCRVKVGSVIEDKNGIFSWGWNHMGLIGLGCCAEAHAISRANPKRLKGSTIYIAGTHRKTGNPVPAKPCYHCHKLILHVGIEEVIWQDKYLWEVYYV